MENKSPEMKESFSLRNQEIMTAFRTLTDTAMSNEAEVRVRTKPFDQQIHDKFVDYLQAMSPYLPEAILYSETHGGPFEINLNIKGKRSIKRQALGYKKYLLPKTARIYVVHNDPPIVEENFPENENFKGFDKIPGEDLDFEKRGFLGYWVDNTAFFAPIAESKLKPEAAHDPKAKEAKEDYENARREYFEEKKKTETELGRDIKTRLTNLRNVIAHHFGESRLPKKIRASIDEDQRMAIYYLAREDKLLTVPLKRTVFGMRPDFSKAQEASLDLYFETPNFAIDFMEKAGLGKLGRQSWHNIG